jgi:hypothetical protein
MNDEPNSRGDAVKVWLAMFGFVALLAALAALILWVRGAWPPH